MPKVNPMGGAIVARPPAGATGAIRAATVVHAAPPQTQVRHGHGVRGHGGRARRALIERVRRSGAAERHHALAAVDGTPLAVRFFCARRRRTLTPAVSAARWRAAGFTTAPSPSGWRGRVSWSPAIDYRGIGESRPASASLRGRCRPVRLGGRHTVTVIEALAEHCSGLPIVLIGQPGRATARPAAPSRPPAAACSRAAGSG